jgi:hypothetical protein
MRTKGRPSPHHGASGMLRYDFDMIGACMGGIDR